MPLSRFVFSALLLALAGCSSSSAPSGSASKANTSATTETQRKLQQAFSPLFAGTIQRQNEQALFTPCGSNQQWQLTVNDSFWQQWQQLGSPQSLQASLSGHLSAGEGRGAPFRLEVDQVSRITADQSICQSSAENYLLKAGNDQPFWSLVLDGQQAALTTPDGVDSYQLDSFTPPTEQQVQLALRNAHGKKASLTLQPGYCQDGASKQWLGYAAHLQLENGQTLDGCGEQGQSLTQQQPAHDWTGHDDAQKADVSLTLDTNHQAKLVYHRDVGPEVTYEGVWQAAQADTVVVMFNKRMGLDTNESIPFHWQGDKLSADYRELDAGKAYFDKPLVLKTTLSGDTGAIATGATDVGSNGGAVVVAPPATSDAPAGENSFAKNETVLNGASSAVPLTGAVSTAVPAAAASTPPTPTTSASFSAGMLQASTQPDAAIEQTLRNFLQNSGSQATGTQYRYVKADLNGDGTLDALVEMNWCDKSGCVWMVLQGKEGQFQQVARLEGFSGSVMVAPSAHNGWNDLLVSSTEQANTFLTLEHDGSSYPSRPTASSQPQPDPNSLLELRFAGDNWLTMP
jgi:putative lipoprotein